MRLVQRKGKKKILSIIKTISKQMYLSEWRYGDELEKEIEEIKSLCKERKAEMWNIYMYK